MRNRLNANESGASYLIAVCGASLLSTVFYYILNGRAGTFAGVDTANWVNYFVMELAFVGISVVYCHVRKADFVSVVKLKPSKNPYQYLLLFPIAFCTILVFYPLALLFLQFLAVIGYPVTSVITINFTSVGVYFLALLCMAILPAIGEEIVCRGMLLGGGLNTRDVTFGIFISALLFSLMHANPMQTVHQFGLGVVLATLFILSGSIVPCMIVHFLNNFITLTVTAYIPKVDQIVADLGYWNFLTGTVSVVVGLFLLAILLYAYYRLGKGKNAEFSLYENKVDCGDYTITVTYDAPTKKKSNFVLDCARFIRSLFTKYGWKKVYYTLYESAGVECLGKAQRMPNVWISIGFAVFYWVLNFLLNLL